jgi:hypothetical protein
MTITTNPHILFPKISQFSTIVHNIKQEFKNDLSLPIVKYTGRVKLHGTNSSIVFLKNDEYYCQSRNTVITPDNDNAGFAKYIHEHIDIFNAIVRTDSKYHLYDSVTVYGEWCGGNIQSGIAIAGLPRMFIVFAVRLAANNEIAWIFDKIQNFYNSIINLYHAEAFRTYDIEIDFNYPHLAQSKLVEFTQAVEQECPVGRYFGIKGIGEGLIFHCDRSILIPELWNFKSKGEKHSKSKVKTIGVVNLERIGQIEKLVEYLLYHNQLEDRPTQAIRVLRESGHEMVSMKEIKLFIDWIATDIVSEHQQEINESGLKQNDIIIACIQKAKIDYKLYLDRVAGVTI